MYNFSGEESSKLINGLKIGVGAIAGYMLMMFVMIYGTSVMRSVIEEKTSRIIEVIISSVKPFQLMMGKIIGIGLVGLTQFLVWIILTGVLIVIMMFAFNIDMASPDNVAQMSTDLAQIDAKSTMSDAFNNIWGLPWLQLIVSFLFYFLGGYFLYSSLYAAIGAAVDSETDTQQFLMPVMLPLMLGFYVTQMSVMTNPEGSAIFWLSMIPFTSPVSMLVRISMGSVELWEVLLSMSLLVITFIGTTWLAGKIYRTGILMYGKKASWKEMFKWLKYYILFMK
jgi:ABC-2 type transport system permease protein